MDIVNLLDVVTFALLYHQDLDELWSVIAFAIVFDTFW